MATGDEAGAVGQTTRTLQIIIVAMAMGLALFLAITVFAIPAKGGLAGGARGPILTWGAAAFGLGGLVLSVVVPGLVADSNRRRLATGKFTMPNSSTPPPGDDAALGVIYQTKTIIGAALLEGPAFFASVAYMIERTPLALGLAIVLMGALLLRFPTLPGVSAWIDEQRDRLQADRAEARMG